MLLDESTEVHRLLARYDSSLPQRVAELVHGHHELTFLARAVSGTFDVDRCDYLLRDAYFTGVGYGSFDLDWLLRSFRLGVPKAEGQAPPLAVDGAKGLPAIESFILARLFMFQQVYFHKASRASEWMLARILGRVRELALDGTRVPGVPPAVLSLATTADASLGDYLSLDDTVLWTALSGFRRAKDSVLADLSSRLVARKLFKTYELYGDSQKPETRYEALSRAREIATRAELDPETYVGLDCASDLPFDDQGASLSVIFPGGVEKKPADVSYLLGRLQAERVERVRLIFAPELRDEIERALKDVA